MRWFKRPDPNRTVHHETTQILANANDNLFSRCSVCGELKARGGGPIFWAAPRGACWDKAGGRCRPEPVTLHQATVITGTTERAIWQELYQWPDIGNLRAEAESHLGMAPPRFTGVTFNTTRTRSVSDTLDVFVHRALPAAPIIDEERAHAEFLTITRVWRNRELWNGSEKKATKVLRVYLSQAAPLYFRIDVYPNHFCAQVSAIRDKSFTGYRVWRTSDRLFLTLPVGSPRA